MFARAKIHCRSNPRSRNERNARSNFGYGQVGRIDRGSANHRCASSETDASGFARYPFWKVCARIHSRNENRSKAVSETASGRGQPSHRKSGPETARAYGLEIILRAGVRAPGTKFSEVVTSPKSIGYFRIPAHR